MVHRELDNYEAHQQCLKVGNKKMTRESSASGADIQMTRSKDAHQRAHSSNPLRSSELPVPAVPPEILPKEACALIEQ